MQVPVFIGTDPITLNHGAGVVDGTAELRIVDPLDVSVLAPTREPTLTLITCYPFRYIGSAPDRFVVRAQAMDVPAKA